MIQVVATTFWKFGGGIMPDNKLWGQLTHCCSERCGFSDFYVRENLDSVQSFYISAGEWWAEKTDRPRDRRQILELCADEHEWELIASDLKHFDKRPIRRNQRFTRTWAVAQFAAC